MDERLTGGQGGAHPLASTPSTNSSASSRSGKLVVFGVHDYNLDDLQLSNFKSFLNSDVDLSRRNPFEHVVVLAGDLNRLKAGEIRAYLDPSQQAHYGMQPSLHQHNISSNARAFDDILSKMVEIDTHPFTHFCKKGNFESRIDRLFWTIPPWISRHCSLFKPVFPPAHNYNARGLSDHAPTGVCLSPRTPVSPTHQPIPSFVTRHPLFRDNLAKIEEQDGLKYNTFRRDSWDTSMNRHNPFKALDTYNRGIRKAAAMTRNFLIQHDNSTMSSDIIASSISRCVFSMIVILLSF